MKSLFVRMLDIDAENMHAMDVYTNILLYSMA